jgi:hypothetical protein
LCQLPSSSSWLHLSVILEPIFQSFLYYSCHYFLYFKYTCKWLIWHLDSQLPRSHLVP